MHIDAATTGLGLWCLTPL